MPRARDLAPDVLEALVARYGAAPAIEDDPGATPFPALVSAWLALSTEARRVPAARRALLDAGLLDAAPLAEADPAEVAQLLASAGVKLPPKALAPLRRLARWASERGPESIAEAPTAALREELIGLKGVGAATADGLLLHALGRPSFPVGRPAYRVFARHGWVDPHADYEEARSAFEGFAPDHAISLRTLAYGLERVAAEFCRVSRPKCDRCPLRPFLPAGGPVGADGE